MISPCLIIRLFFQGLGLSHSLNVLHSPSHELHLQLVLNSSTKYTLYPAFLNKVLNPFPLTGSLYFLCLYCSKSPKPIIVSDSSDLLAQIREGGLKNLKSASQSQSLNSEEFTYTASKENKPSMPREGLGGVLAQAMQARRCDIEDSEELDEAMVEKLEKLSPQQQLNELYSAVIDGDKTRIARIIDVGNSEVFTKENMEKIASAAQKISATQDVSKKTIIEAGVKELAKEAKININVGESRGRS